MNVLNEKNEIINTDREKKKFFFSVLSFKDYKNPDFYMDRPPHLEFFESTSACLEIGNFKIIVPLPWSILTTDLETVELVPLTELFGTRYSAFVINPIDGYVPQFLPVRLRTVFRDTNWTSPPIGDKDLLVVPFGYDEKKPNQAVDKGPLCAIFSPSKLELSKPISDIW